MKKVLLSFIFLMIVFGVMLNSPIVFADENDSDEDVKAELISEIEDEIGNEMNGDEIRSRITSDKDSLRIRNEEMKKRMETYIENIEKNKIESLEVRGEDGKVRVVRVEREIVTEDGIQKIKIKRKIIDRNNDTIEEKIMIWIKTEDGIIKRKIVREVNGKNFEIETELEIEDDFGNESNLKATLSNGRKALIKVMPDRASQVAIERLKTNNFTIELKEVGNEEERKAIYKAKTKKNGRFLGIFKMKMELEADIDPETGEIIGFNKPWWAFTVSGEENDQTGEEERTEDETIIVE